MRGTGEIVGGLTDSAIEREAIARAREQLARAVPAIRSRADRRQRSLLRDQHPAARARDLRRRTRHRAAGAAGQDARFCRDHRRCPHGVPDGRSLSRRDAGVRAFQSVRRHRATASRQLRARDESPPRARSGKPPLRARFRGRVHRRARARARGIRKLLAGLAAQGYVPPRRASRACEARWASRSARRHPKKWRCPFWAKSSRFDADSRAGFSAARSAVFTVPKPGGSWRARSPRACRYPSTDRRETAGPVVRSWCRWSTGRAPCCNWASSGKNSRSNRCGGAMTSPYRTLTMAGACWR